MAPPFVLLLLVGEFSVVDGPMFVNNDLPCHLLHTADVLISFVPQLAGIGE